MGVKLGSLTLREDRGCSGTGAEENIWTCERESNRRLKKRSYIIYTLCQTILVEMEEDEMGRT